MPKDILYNEDARRALERGVDKLANAVNITLAPWTQCGFREKLYP